MNTKLYFLLAGCLVAENIIEAWQYDKGTCMPLPVDFGTAIAIFQAVNYAAGQIKQ